MFGGALGLADIRSVGGGAMRRAAVHRLYGLLDRHSLVHFVQIIAGVGALTRAGTSTLRLITCQTRWPGDTAIFVGCTM